MKKQIKWTKKQLVVTGIILVSVFVCSSSAIKSYQKNQEINQTKKILQLTLKQLECLDETIMQLRDQENPEFLVKDITLSEIEKLDQQIKQLKLEQPITTNNPLDELVKKVETSHLKLNEQIDSIKAQLNQQEAVNRLFSDDEIVAINGTKVHLELAISDDLIHSNSGLLTQDAQNTDKIALIPTTSSEEISWQQTINSLIEQAKEQVMFIEDMTKTVDCFYESGNVIDSLDLTRVNEVEKQIKTIKNETARNELLEKIKQAKETLTNKEKALKPTDKTSNVTENQSDEIRGTKRETSGNVAKTSSDNDYSDGNHSTYNDSSTPNSSSQTSSNNSPTQSSNGTWSANVNATEGGVITGDGSNGGPGSNTWTGGEFDGSGIPEW